MKHGDLFNWLQQLTDSADISPQADADRCGVLGQVADLGAAAVSVIPTLIVLLKRRPEAPMNEWVRGLAADCLRNVGPSAGDAVPVLCQCMDETYDGFGEKWFRLRCAHALTEIQRNPTIVITEACNLLRDRQWDLRAIAAQTLGLLGKNGKSAVGNLQTALADTSKRVRQAAESAIHEITKEKG